MESTTPRRLVDLERVDVRIAGAAVLHDIDWQLSAGTHWGVVGPNGSGKSTFLCLVAGTIWPAPGHGTRRYDFGRGVQTDAIEARQKITLVGPELQNRYARWGWNFTAEQVVLSGLFRTDTPRRHPAPADRIRARALLRRVGLAHLAARGFLELSRGEQRHILIARAMAFKPAVLLLDEPASGLDPHARAELDAMITAAAASTTVVCSAHLPSDLPSVTAEILHLDSGRIVARSSASRAIPARQPVEQSSGTGAAPEPAPRAAAALPLIEIERVDVWIRERHVLEDLNWRLEAGEHWLVTGPNGAGKSTFLRLLHGQLRPALGGRIAWPALGDPRNVWQLRRQIGYVSPELQAEYRLPATVRECVASGIESSIGLTRSLTAAEARQVADLLERFELTALAERPLTSLSYGQMHRVLLARTLVNAPRVLLLDEPWEGLDRATRILVGAEVRRAMTAGTQVVCASHLSDEGIEFTHELTIAASRAHGRRRGRFSNADARAEPRGSSPSAPPRERGCRPR